MSQDHALYATTPAADPGPAIEPYPEALRRTPDAEEDELSEDRKYAGALADITACCVSVLKEADIGRAAELGIKVMERITDALGGQVIYLPFNRNYRAGLRNLRIWHEYDGTRGGLNGTAALAKRYKLSEIWIYRILDEQRELHRKKVQMPLPGMDSSGN